MLRIELAKSKNNQPATLHSAAERYAIRFGLLTAVIIVVYNLLVMAAGDGGFELSHIGIFIILFLMIGLGTHNARKWIRAEHAMGDQMLFGILLSVITAFGLIALNGLLVIIDYHLIVSTIFLPIDDLGKFAVNSMALFWTCLIFGLFSTFVFSHFYNK